MNKAELNLNGYRVLIFDAPKETTHSNVAIYDGLNVIFYKKTKVLELVCLDDTKSDSELGLEYYGENRILNIGKLEYAPLGSLDVLFDIVKRGNFYEYVSDGNYFVSPIGALKSIIKSKFNYENPYVVLIK